MSSTERETTRIYREVDEEFDNEAAVIVFDFCAKMAKRFGIGWEEIEIKDKYGYVKYVFTFDRTLKMWEMLEEDKKRRMEWREIARNHLVAIETALEAEIELQKVQAEWMRGDMAELVGD